ncbi:hypothetical protein EDB85DRAFT_1904960 [Lactarius pseudohatsudake]|nr:hypothetical protein EDB85DRAFT_1904960 [Lactarius pseudohatsudake]
MSASAKLPNPATPAPREAPSFDISGEKRLTQDIVDDALVHGVWITRARRLRGQELVEVHPNTWLAVVQVMRARCRRHQGCRRNGVHEA